MSKLTTTRLSRSLLIAASLLVLASAARAEIVAAGVHDHFYLPSSPSFGVSAGVLADRNADPEVTYAGTVIYRGAALAAGAIELSLRHEKTDSAPGSVPEPGTLAIAGTAVLGIAGLLRRKLQA